MRHFLRRGVISLAITAAIACSMGPQVARADAGAGAIRLGADAGIIGLQLFPVDRSPDVVSFQFGLWNGSVYRPQVGASFAYQVTDAILIGARLGFGVLVIDVGGFGSSTAGLFSLMPFFEFMFGEGNIRPFIGAEAGFQAIFPDNTPAQAWFVGGGLGGVHIFAESGFSISPTAVIDFLYRGDFERAGVGLSGLISFEGWID